MSQFMQFIAPHRSGEPIEATIQSASECLDRFTDRFNAADIAGMDAELHFPHVMLSGALRLDWSTPGSHPEHFFDDLKSTGWHHTQYQSKEPVLVDPDKVHFVVTYSRTSVEGTLLSLHKNLWIVTRVDGKWGICLRSY